MGKSKRKRNKNIISLYALKGIKDRSAIRIKHLKTGTIEFDQKIQDTSISKYEINNYIYGEIFQCNITHSSLMASKKQPMIYVTIIMVKPLKMAVLCNIILYFTIKDDIKSVEQLLSSSLEGSYSLEISIDNNNKHLDKEITVFPGKKEIIEEIMNLTKDEQMINILKELVDIEETKIAKKYGIELDHTIPTNIISLTNYKLDEEYDSLSEDEKEVINDYHDEIEL